MYENMKLHMKVVKHHFKKETHTHTYTRFTHPHKQILTLTSHYILTQRKKRKRMILDPNQNISSINESKYL